MENGQTRANGKCTGTFEDAVMKENAWKIRKKTNHDLLRFFLFSSGNVPIVKMAIQLISFWPLILILMVPFKTSCPDEKCRQSTHFSIGSIWKNTLTHVLTKHSFFIRVCISFLFCAIDCIFCEKKLPRVTNEQCHKATNIHFLTTMQKAFLLDVFISESRIFEEKAIFRGFLHLGIW